MPSFAVRTFGCRCNQAEAFEWTDELQRHGWQFLRDPFRSDWVLVNTCTITSRADRDVRNFLSRMGRDNPGARMAVTGCYAERRPEELARYPGVWKVLPNSGKEGLPRLLLEAESGNPAPPPGPRPFRSRPLVKIQDGCDFRCTYCVIPGVRGPSVSIPPEKVEGRVRALLDRGFQEIVLTGIHLGLYGRDLDPPSSFSTLLERICALEGRWRCRLSSLDPRFLDDRKMDLITGEPRVCPHFHISLQHGSDRVIARMGRRITTADYRRILDALRERAPEAALGTDIIVGFPGETEEDFREMKTFLEESPLTYFHVFSFSPRPGTPAAEWEPVHSETVKRRAALLRGLAREKRRAFREGKIGRESEAVVIRSGDKGARVLTGDYIDVRVSSCSVPASRLVRVKLTGFEGDKARGVIVAPGVSGEDRPRTELS